MGVLQAEEFMTAERRERVQLANAMDVRNQDRLDTAKRPGGYFHSSAGVPQDANGLTIPEAEWTDEDLLHIRGQAALDVRKGVVRAEGAEQDVDAGTPAPAVKDGADQVEGSGSELRTVRPGGARAQRR